MIIDQPNVPRKRFPRELLVIFICISAIIMAGGWYFYHIQKKSITILQFNELSAVADLKVAQIENWRKERRMAGEVIFNSPIFIAYIENYLQNPRAAAPKKNIVQQMKALMQYGDYANIYLLDADSQMKLAVLEKNVQLGIYELSRAAKAIRTGKVIFSDIHRDPSSGAIHIDVIVPLVPAGRDIPHVIGVVILQIDPGRFLYPMIQAWPTPSTSAETFLVRREGKDIVFLNELRHKKNTALTFRMPIDAPELPAARAVRGYTDMIDGIDYRGEPVFATARQIPETDWFIISKIDKSEVFAPLLKQATYIAIISLLMIIAVGAVFGALWQRESVAHYRLLYASERKRQEEHELAEKALRESEQRYKSLFDSSLDCIYRINNKGLFVMVNRAGAELFGFQSPEEVIGTSVLKLWADDGERKHFFELLQREKILKGFQVRAKQKNGMILHLEVSCHMLEDEQGNSLGMEGIVRDITERKALEEQLRQSQKIEAIGTLAGGVAHDFNNILTAIIGYAHVVLMKLKADDPLRHELQQVLAAADRAALLTQSLLAFSRKQPVNLAAVDINEVIRKFNEFLSRLIREDVELRTVTASGALTVMADKGQIEQALMNMVSNAQDAMPNGGRLTIETKRAHLDESYISAHGYGRTGDYALISVSDTGSGMDEHTLQKIFEPFFTTKEQGKGTGMGLAMVYGTVKKHEGFINVESEPGNGAMFKIYLPLTEAQPESIGRQGSAKTASLPGGTETILVAEDDEASRKLVSTVLAEFGYRVLPAENGEDAIRRFAENKDSVQLAILDVIMPKKNGFEVFKEISALRPDLKIIFLSGYSESVLDEKVLRDKRVTFIMKPVSPLSLLKKVRDVLDGKA